MYSFMPPLKLFLTLPRKADSRPVPGQWLQFTADPHKRGRLCYGAGVGTRRRVAKQTEICYDPGYPFDVAVWERIL
jgi:hypothetical protein